MMNLNAMLDCSGNLHKRCLMALLTGSLIILSISPTYADQSLRSQEVNECLASAVQIARPEQTVAELISQCESEIEESLMVKQTGAMRLRKELEKDARSNPFAILPHKPTYILPFTYSEPKLAPYGNILQGRDFDDTEVKFQVSMKYVAVDDLFTDDLSLQLGFTATSFWQAYNSDISAPFRETNYEPELILNYGKPWSLFGLPIQNSYISFNHQSNGQAGILSRSWNRIIGGIAFGTDDIVWSARAWYRLPEDDKPFPDSPEGDDNPNIENFMGYGDLGMLWMFDNDHNLDIQLRNNLKFDDNRGSITLGYSFPLTDQLRGYVEYFNGYGESLIYYDQHTQRLGIGIKLTDWL